jgi:hypothetical protein
MIRPQYIRFITTASMFESNEGAASAAAIVIAKPAIRSERPHAPQRR